MSKERVLPHDAELEMQVLGAMLMSRSVIVTIASIIDTDSFHRERHKRIFDMIMKLYSQGKPVDVVILSRELERMNILEECGGIPYLGDIAASVATKVNVEYHAQLLRELQARRNAIILAEQIKTEAYDEPDIFDALANANAELIRINSQRGSIYQHIGNDIDTAWSELERESKGEIIGIPTGWPTIDKYLHLRKGSLNTIAGESGHGKSVMLSNIATSVAARGIPVAIFSLEMSIVEYQARMIKHLARTAIGFGSKLSDYDWRQLQTARKKLQTLPIYFDETPSISPEMLRARCQQMFQEHEIGLVIIDYLQLMRVPGNEPLRVKIGICTGAMKQIAKELHLPVVTASQFRKRSKESPERRTADDLAESKSIETDSDVIIILQSLEQTAAEYDRGDQRVRFGIQKQRNGIDGKRIEMTWHKRHMTFDCNADLENASAAEHAYRGEPQYNEEV